MQSPALQTPTGARSPAAVARVLTEALRELSVPSDVLALRECAVVSLWYGLVAYTDGHLIWWVTPQRSMRGRELVTFAYAPATAAARLAEHYAIARNGCFVLSN